MKLETFFEKFEVLAEMPGAVGKLRELVVQLAIDGKLVSNDPAEHAVTLKLSGAPSASISRPLNWREGIVGDIFTFEYGDNLPAPKRTQSGEYPVYGSNGIVGTHSSYLTKEPAIIVGRKGSAGALNVAAGPSWTTDVAYFVRPPNEIDLRFTFYLFSTLRLTELGKGIKPGLSRNEAYAIPIAIPPFAEQKRIVARVDELMALCDRLEAQQQECETRHTALARASLVQFADAPTPASLQFLFHPSYAITPDDLRKSILTLAPRGLLVEQRDSEGVAELNSEVPFSREELPYDLPDGWVWKRLGNLVEFIGGSQPPKSKFIYAPRDGYTRFIQIRDFKSDANLTFIPTALANRPFKEDDVMIGRYGPPVFQILRGLSGTYNVALMKAEPISKLISKDFLFYLLLEPRIQDRVIAESDRTAGQSGVRKPLLHSFVVAIPPLAEQRRIVAKVEQLMGLVDALESKLATSCAAAQNILTGLNSELGSSP